LLNPGLIPVSPLGWDLLGWVVVKRLIARRFVSHQCGSQARKIFGHRVTPGVSRLDCTAGLHDLEVAASNATRRWNDTEFN
jgi:hypothetical protein